MVLGAKEDMRKRNVRTSSQNSTLVLRFLVFAVVHGVSHACSIKTLESDAVPQLFVC